MPAKTIIALTDGNDTKSQVPPIEAAKIAKERGIRIHTVAIGDPETVGEDKLDEEALRDVAATAGGAMVEGLAAFHFMRPLWLCLLSISVAVWLWWKFGADPLHNWRSPIEPHLLAALTAGDRKATRRFKQLLLTLWIAATVKLGCSRITPTRITKPRCCAPHLH